MTLYRRSLPQLGDQVFVTDGGLETAMVFIEGIDLPEFAAYDMLRTAEGEETLLRFYRPYMDLVREHQVGLLLETPTWRASRDWGAKIGDDPGTLADLNRRAVALMERLRAEFAADLPVVISGQMGPRGDGYQPDKLMSADQARDYHAEQVATFADTAVDMVSALTLNYVDEAIGVTRAAMAAGLPVCISFTVETDGQLPTGETLEQAIDQVDEATNNGPAYYQINCAHTTHFDSILEGDGRWLSRIRGVRGNASRMSHEELDNSTVLDDGNPEEFGAQTATLHARMPNLTVLGGCCGTDHRHIAEICRHVSGAL
jgi:S-methylmethionine-dependent homocysteine/selenocysteine methylase